MYNLAEMPCGGVVAVNCQNAEQRREEQTKVEQSRVEQNTHVTREVLQGEEGAPGGMGNGTGQKVGDTFLHRLSFSADLVVRVAGGEGG